MKDVTVAYAMYYYCLPKNSFWYNTIQKEIYFHGLKYCCKSVFKPYRVKGFLLYRHYIVICAKVSISVVEKNKLSECIAHFKMMF